jgi:hypothetical protein
VSKVNENQLLDMLEANYKTLAEFDDAIQVLREADVGEGSDIDEYDRDVAISVLKRLRALNVVSAEDRELRDADTDAAMAALDEEDDDEEESDDE